MFANDVVVKGLDNKSPERLLYIGNSYLYYNDSLHNHVRRMLEESYGRKIKTNSCLGQPEQVKHLYLYILQCKMY